MDFPFIGEKQRNPDEGPGTTLPSGLSCARLQLPLQGWPLALWPGPLPAPHYELQFPDANTSWTLLKGLPSSLAGEEPHPSEQLPRSLPPAPPMSRDTSPPTGTRGRAAGGGRGRGGRGGGANPGGGGAGPGSRAAWQRRRRLEPEVGARSQLTWLRAGCCWNP